MTTTLSICIPTYRRPEMLRRCIESAVESAVDRPIRIHVADDSMSDVNRAVLDDLAHRFPFLHVERNTRNLGIDANIQRVADMSDGDYFWLMGEDDRFLPRGIARMHDRLQRTTDPFVFSNYQFANDTFERIVGQAVPDAAEQVPLGRFIADRLWSVGFIGSSVIRRDAWKRTDPAPYSGTYFTHVGRIVEALRGCAHVPIATRPALLNRSQGADTFTWKHDSFGVYFGFERMCRVAAQRLPELRTDLEAAIERYRARVGYLSLKSTFRLRSQGAFDWRQYTTYIRPAPISASRKLWLLGLALTPPALLRPFAAAYLSLKERRRSGDAPGVAP